VEATEYFNLAVKKIQPLYTENEARELLYWLFEDILLIKKAHLNLFTKELSFTEELQLNTLVDRLLAGEPIQYILGYAYFMDFVLEVNEAVLIPRPETEELVQTVLSFINARSEPKDLKIVDICAGSGCIALAIKKNLPTAQLIALDVSAHALAIVEHNSKKLKLPVKTLELSVLDESGINYLTNCESLIWVSNPPYITEQEKLDMHKNVLNHEPHLALFVQHPDALLFYRNIAQAFCKNEHATDLFFETSEYQGTALLAMAAEFGLKAILKKDMQAKDRILHLSKK